MRIAIMLTLIITALSFGEGQTKKIDLPQALQRDIIPYFFVLDPDENKFFRENVEEAVKKLGTKRVVLSFFASWCEKCMAEVALMRDNNATLTEKGVQVYMIDIGENIKEDGKKVSEFVEKYADNKFPYYFDPKGNLLRNFGIIERNSNQYTLPVTVVMDSKLRVLYMLKGEIENDFPQILWEGL